ncbi:hypothetical protein GQ42DRAFT_56864 [Ramicandelaber brevisporus]|nr:hypothetical protein GQ42DRAFT_56864 [Ramicandelaber brevisporus]
MRETIVAIIRQRIPLLSWISRYDRRRDLASDLVAGLTISTIIVPQSMAYAMLAGLPPVYGLYTSVVPIILYAVFGTCPHMSTGTFALTSLLLGQAVQSILAKEEALYGTHDHDSQHHGSSGDDYDPSGMFDEDDVVAKSLEITFWVGVVQLLMSVTGIARFIGTYLLPDALISGFTTAASFHIATSQIGNLFGVSMPRRSGVVEVGHSSDDSHQQHGQHNHSASVLVLPRQWWYLLRNLASVKWPTAAMGLAAITVMYLLKKVEDRRVKQRKREHKAQQNGSTETMLRNGDRTTVTFPQDYATNGTGDSQPKNTATSNNININTNNINNVNRGDRHVRFRLQSNASSVNSAQQQHQPKQQAVPIVQVLPMSRGRTIEETRTSRPTKFRAPLVARPRLPSVVALLNAKSPNAASSLVTSSLAAVTTVEPLPEDVDPPTTLKEAVESSNVHIPIPSILITILVFTTATALLRLDQRLSISVIGHIPSGFPHVQLPLDPFPTEWDIFLSEIPSAVLIAIISFVMSISIGRTFETKHSYDVPVEDTQEMFALGLSSLLGSFFSSYVSCGSLTRSAVLSAAGARTHLANLIGVIVVVLTLLWLTSLFYFLPHPVLGAVIVMACQSLAAQIMKVPAMFERGQHADLVLWIGTFAAVLLINVEMGILTGVAIALAIKAYTWFQRSKRDQEYVRAM